MKFSQRCWKTAESIMALAVNSYKALPFGPVSGLAVVTHRSVERFQSRTVCSYDKNWLLGHTKLISCVWSYNYKSLKNDQATRPSSLFFFRKPK